MLDWTPIAISLAALLLSFLSYRATRWRQRAADLSISARTEHVPVPDAPGMTSELCIYVVNRGEHDAYEVRVLLHREQGPYAYEEIASVVARDQHRLTCWWEDETSWKAPVPFTMTITWADGRRGRHSREVEVTYVDV